ncbi:DUF2637 domain-containing protein [Streptomyces sp. NPDC056160]|uniref:DUF2637 domain-containing protein n=1 Tax=Streptomyces sp. NPDC056160 TaxID=3345731 RepID=UPI0035D538D9
MADSNGERHTAPERDRQQLTPLQRRLIAGVALGGAAIALIGFIGSYAAVRALAEAKRFGTFALLFPIGLDAGILVLLALDMLLTWLRMPLGLLRQTAWLLTAATIAFNAAAAAGDPLAMGMHAVIPVLFVVVVEAARHAVGIAADISAAKHMESVRLSRWLLAPFGTFLLWRRMKLWELRSYDEVIALEQERLTERARLRREYGRRWRSRAPLPEVLALRLTRYGRPLAPVVVDAAPLPEVEYKGAPAFAPAPQGAPALPAPPSAAPEQGAPQRPAPQIEGAPERPAPEPEGAPQGDAPVDQSAPHADGGGDQGAPGEDAPDDEGAPERPAGEDEAPRDEQRPPTRDEVKRRIRALYDELDARPGEGRIVALLKSLDGYPYTSRRHAQTLRDEIERKEPKLAERGSDNVRALTGT